MGPDHPAVAYVLNNLGMVLEETGDYSGAKRLYERALAIRENAVGPEDPFVASTTANLAILHQLLGDYAVSRKLYERALAQPATTEEFVTSRETARRATAAPRPAHAPPPGCSASSLPRSRA